MVDAKTQLKKLYSDISQSLNKIASRENYLNQQLQAPLTIFCDAQNVLANVRMMYHKSTTGLTQKSAQLSQVGVFTSCNSP